MLKLAANVELKFEATGSTEGQKNMKFTFVAQLFDEHILSNQL